MRSWGKPCPKCGQDIKEGELVYKVYTTKDSVFPLSLYSLAHVVCRGGKKG